MLNHRSEQAHVDQFGLINEVFPNEVMLYIFSFLKLKDFFAIFLVNKRWAQLACDNLLWENMAVRDSYVSHEYFNVFRNTEDDKFARNFYRTEATRNITIFARDINAIETKINIKQGARVGALKKMIHDEKCITDNVKLEHRYIISAGHIRKDSDFLRGSGIRDGVIIHIGKEHSNSEARELLITDLKQFLTNDLLSTND